MKSFGASFAHCSKGATAVEYGVMIALIALMAIGGMEAAGVSINTVLDHISSSLS